MCFILLRPISCICFGLKHVCPHTYLVPYSDSRISLTRCKLPPDNHTESSAGKLDRGLEEETISGRRGSKTDNKNAKIRRITKTTKISRFTTSFCPARRAAAVDANQGRGSARWVLAAADRCNLIAELRRLVSQRPADVVDHNSGMRNEDSQSHSVPSV
jgi:hypothetical protein